MNPSARTAALLAGVGLGACSFVSRQAGHPQGKLAATAQSVSHAGEVHSNLLRSDYAGSEACSGCHVREYAAWRDSPMHRMTRDLQKTRISAPFAGNTFAFRADSVKLEQLDGQRFMRLHQSGAAPSAAAADDAKSGATASDTLFRVTKVIGGRYREDFVGFEVDPASPHGAARDVERILPVSYLVFNGEWRYKGYSVMVRERPALEPGVVWKTGCIFCHNTAPTLSLLLDDVYSEYGQRAHSYQGSASIELPDDKRPHYAVSDEAALKRALSAELSYLGSSRDIADY
ncbi:MAG TPA: hypothetical protein VHM25_13420, partial [Polyangiaceae bacterium]|nr:hypothetical protein [Polyangiaceae bacterium]